MYLKYFGLSVKPFSITPDPGFLYLSTKHREGLAHLLYGTDESSSFVVLTGEVGTGKTTLCRRLLEQAPTGVAFALILNSLQTPLELLASICDEFGIDYDKTTTSRKYLIDQINVHLLKVHAAGERSVLVIDEAQNLSAETLEQVRLLTNLETGSSKLLKIILLGQPELKVMLARPELRQLSQRVTARHHLQSLSADEVGDYLRHRLQVAGANRKLFTPAAIRKLYQVSGGIPRIINLVADRALTGAYGLQREIVDKNLLARAASEVSGVAHTGAARWLKWGLVTLGLIFITTAAYWWGSQKFAQTLVSKETPAVVEPVNTAVKRKPVDQQATAAASTVTVEKTPVANVRQPEDVRSASATMGLGAVLATPDAGLSAFPKVFELWQLDYTSLQGDSACERVRNAGLRCLYAEGTVDDLVYYNLAAVVELAAGQGPRRQAIVTAIDNDQLSLVVAAETHTVSAADLDDYWNGNFLLFWRPAPSGSTVIRPGDQSDDVLWLQQGLDRIENITHSEAKTSRDYDETLRRRVMKFQLENDLYPDGVAGEKTLIKLTAAVTDDRTPVLAEVK